MKVVITGAGGYIGSVATYVFLQNGFEVVAIDNLDRGYRQPIDVLQKKFGQERLRFYQVDLQDKTLEKVFDQESGIDAVVHYAALCLVSESVEKPDKYFTNNICGSLNLLNIMLSKRIKTLVFSSTCAVYGNAQYVPVDENHPTVPANPYGESKRIVEKIIEWYGKSLGLKYVILRYFNVCGASDDGFIGDSKKPSVLLIQNAVRGALGIEPFSLTCATVNTPDKTPIRDYVNVVDLNYAHLKAVNYLVDNGENQIINIGTGTGNSVLEIINTVKNITGKEFNIGKAEPRKGEYDKMIASIEKAQRVLDWEPQRSIEDTVNSLIKWYKEHPNGWEN